MMAQLYTTLAVGVARGVVACVIHAVRDGAAVRLGSREDIVRVRHVADAVDRLALFVQSTRLVDAISQARGFKRVAVQFGYVGGDDLAASVGPRTGADAIPRVDSAWTLRAEV